MTHTLPKGNPSADHSTRKTPFRKTIVTLWKAPAFRNLSLAAKVLIGTLRTSHITNPIPGVVKIGRSALHEASAFDLLSPQTVQPESLARPTVGGNRRGQPLPPTLTGAVSGLDILDAALAELEAAGFLEHDLDHYLIWLPAEIQVDFPANHKVIWGWRDFWGELEDCELKERIRQHLTAALAGKHKLAEAFDLITGQIDPNGKGEPTDTTNGIPLRLGGTVGGNHRTANSEQRTTTPLPPPSDPGGGEEECVVGGGGDFKEGKKTDSPSKGHTTAGQGPRSSTPTRGSWGPPTVRVVRTGKSTASLATATLPSNSPWPSRTTPAGASRAGLQKVA